MKKNRIKLDSTVLEQVIKAARKARGARNKLADEPNIAPRFIVAIKNSGGYPSRPIFYELAFS